MGVEFVFYGYASYNLSGNRWVEYVVEIKEDDYPLVVVALDASPHVTTLTSIFCDDVRKRLEMDIKEPWEEFLSYPQSNIGKLT